VALARCASDVHLSNDVIADDLIDHVLVDAASGDDREARTSVTLKRA
jgi:hypothetical protein